MISKDTDKKLFLLDAYALIFRAYYAFIRNPQINSKGFNTSAVFGFTNALLDIINNEKPSHLAVVFDPPGPTFRKEAFEAYKANRDETPEDIKLSVPFIKEILKGFGVPVIEQAGYEADDVIGHIAKHAEKDGYLTYMMTPDKDFAQLVSENIFMYKPGRLGKPAEIWGVPEVRERYGIKDAEQVIDILGLMGDAADNIPGVPGIGEKTAIKLIGQYYSIENLLEHTHELKGKQKENVENFKEQALMSKMLATIVIDLNYVPDYDDIVRSEMDTEKLREVFGELEFRTLAKRVLGEDTTPNEGEQISMFGSAEGPSAEEDAEEPEQASFNTIESTPHNYHFVDTDADLDKLLGLLQKAEVYCFDTETSELDPLNADIVGMSFSTKVHEGWYVSLLGEAKRKTRLEKFRSIFEDPNKTVVAQNLKFDFKILLNRGIEIRNKSFDTMIAHYLLNPDLRHGMDYLAETYLNYKPVSITTLIGPKGKNQGSMADLSAEEISDYACEDADITLQLYEKFKPEMQDPQMKKLFDDVETPLLKVLGHMEMEGVKLDVETLKTFSLELGIEIEALEKSIIELAGETFNVDSPKQLGPILFDKLGIGSSAKKTKSGQYSTGEDILSKLVNEHPIIEKILAYRQSKKLKSTYVDPLPTMVNNHTGRVHTNYMQTVAATGRLSSNNPNLQNIPIRTERGREIRKAFIPRDENYLLLAADYSQVELRIIAALSKDEAMCKAFHDEQDIHATTAAKVFGVVLDDVTREMRSKAKAVNFGIIYGQGAFGLAQNLNIRRGEAKEIIDNYYAQFPGLKEYQTSNIEFARENGYVETILGRRRYLKDILSSNAVVRGFAERNAINAPIQGSAADVIKIAMVKLHAIFEKENFKSKMIMQVHDELVFDAYKEEIDRKSVV